MVICQWLTILRLYGSALVSALSASRSRSSERPAETGGYRFGNVCDRSAVAQRALPAPSVSAVRGSAAFGSGALPAGDEACCAVTAGACEAWARRG